MKYLTRHENRTALDVIKAKLAKPQVALINEDNSIYYVPAPSVHDYSQDYFTIESLEDSNIISWKNNSSLTKTISVSVDNGLTWTNKTSANIGVVLAKLNTGDKLLVKGSNSAYGNNMSYCNFFESTKEFNVEGNIMSLCYNDNFIGQTTLDSQGYNFSNLFNNCTKLISAENLILPATTLEQNCYRNMFRGCTSLTAAPELPATTLEQNCYLNMFSGCTSLNYVKCLATDISATNCTNNWLTNVASTGTFVKAASMSSWTTGASGIPSGWGILNDNETPITWSYISSYAINLFIKPKLCNPFNLPVIYNSSNTSVATIDNSGNVTFVSEGTVTLTAVFAGNETYQAKTTTCQIQITAYDYIYNYFTIESLEDNNTISWKANNSSLTKTISVSTDNGETWTNKTSDTTGVTLATLNIGDKLLIKGSNVVYGDSNYHNYFASTGEFNVEGNIMSMIYGDNFIGQTTLDSTGYNLRRLFANCTKLISAENLILPATTLANSCYNQMFSGCRSLTTAPELPATTLANSCYNYMFYNCTSLTTVPELPATTLAEGCYQSMFSGCTSLTTAPELPATTLTIGCYSSMFNYCTSLTTAPELPATKLISSCYKQMFKGCTSLNYVKCLAINISASICTSEWLSNVAPIGTFVKADNMTSWSTGVNGIPSGWTKMNNGELPIAWDYTSSYAINSYIKPKLDNPFNLPITYSSSDTSIATIDNSGNVTFVSEGTVTLTAVFAGNETYQAKTTTCQIQIIPFDYSQDYFTIESLEDNNTISWKANNSSLTKTISVSTDNGSTWTSKQSTTSGVTLATLNTGDKLLIKGTNDAYGSSNSSCYNYFVSTKEFNVSGNIMSMIYGNNFARQTTLDSKGYNFGYLFYNCIKLISAENLILSATTLADHCYDSMFMGCSSLTTAPELPATTLADYCYTSMFYRCTSLTTAPELPATTSPYHCYQSMFANCKNLTTAPELPATTLGGYCYQYMFEGCTSLTSAPELLATTLVSGCYRQMFKGCTSLNYVKCLATNISASSCTDEWLSNVAPTGTFVKADNMTSWTFGTNGIPSSWKFILTVTQDNQIKNGTLGSADPNISWSSSSYTITSSYSSSPSLNNPNNVSITYSSSNTSVATINSSGKVTPGRNGSATITATFNGNATYKPCIVHYSLTVNIYTGGSSGGGGGGE